ncbi:MAG TPA: GIY-YIG nuclease family protein [Anaerolineae bacterium]|nr:GIY-YIG nuclease family protein [Anaerolineae bacterium]HQK12974.1 GIY-YIG nuclease family protein [Anaerolineae bacterium]
MWYLYVLQCGDASFYTGITNDVPRRVAEHQAGRGARYTRSRLPVALLAAWRYPDRGAATHAEAAFKKLRRAAKRAYVESHKPFLGAPFALETPMERQ